MKLNCEAVNFTQGRPNGRRRSIVDRLNLRLPSSKLHLKRDASDRFCVHIIDGTFGRLDFGKRYESTAFFNFHWNVDDFTKRDELISQKLLGDVVAGHTNRIARALLFQTMRNQGGCRCVMDFFLGQTALFAIAFGRKLLVHWKWEWESEIEWVGVEGLHRMMSKHNELQLWMRFESRSPASGVVLAPALGTISEPWVDENGWYEATFASGTIRLRSCPFGRLNDIWSCFMCGFWMAEIAPLLNNLRATSRASRASTARFGSNGFSGSCFGALCACKAFFYGRMKFTGIDIWLSLNQFARNFTFFFNFWYFACNINSSSVKFEVNAR